MNYTEINEIKVMIVLKKMMTSLQQQLKPAFKALGINESEFYVLFALDVNGPMTIQEIGQKVDLTSGTMTYVIDKLEHKLWIRRVRHFSDRRKINIELTDQGQQIWLKMMSQHKKQMSEMFGHMEEEELIQLITLMKKVGKGHVT